VVDPEKSWFKLMKRNWPKRTLISTSTNRWNLRSQSLA
jgi:hypothetical protein